jgi:hypothetical protein
LSIDCDAFFKLHWIFYFILISKKTLLKKQKALLSTQEHPANPQEPTHAQNPKPPKTQNPEETPKKPKLQNTSQKKPPPKIHENTPKTLNPKYKQTQKTKGKTQEQQPSKDPKQKPKS